MSNRYYIPSIEEFHVGFEFERENVSGDQYLTCKFLHTSDLGLIKNWIERGYIRVKKLDKQDILECGWKSDINLFYKKGECTLIQDDTNISIVRVISEEDEPFEDEFIFNGTIKNKSELLQIMKMVGIKTPEAK